MINGTLKALGDKLEISKAQKSFEQKLDRNADRTDVILIGYPGGHIWLRASWSKTLDIWWAHKTSNNNRFWNAFGIGEPQWDGKHSNDIACEINPPFEGIKRRMAGVYAKGANGDLYLCT
jgi:hypothetical protein